MRGFSKYILQAQLGMRDHLPSIIMALIIPTNAAGIPVLMAACNPPSAQDIFDADEYVTKLKKSFQSEAPGCATSNDIANALEYRHVLLDRKTDNRVLTIVICFESIADHLPRSCAGLVCACIRSSIHSSTRPGQSETFGDRDEADKI